MKYFLVLVAVVLCSCSGFHLGYTPGGNPPAPVHVRDTLVDTTIVPSDSIVVKTRNVFSDTLLNSTFAIRAGNYAELRYTVQFPRVQDSSDIYGQCIAADTLGFSASNGSSAFHTLNNVSLQLAGNMDRYQLTMPYTQGQSNGLRWYNKNPVDLQVNALLLVGYSSVDSNQLPTMTTSLYEYRQVALRSNHQVPANASIWEKIPVESQDSLAGVSHPAQGLRANLLTSAEMTDFINSGSEGTGLWQSAENSEISLQITQADTLYYVISNDSSVTLAISDTIMLSRQLTASSNSLGK